ncbi:MAG TPA: HAMP domain-containing sensor histidine kinase [Terriglobia bacterium]|jgi:two-component system sensor histidine kinase GlrK
MVWLSLLAATGIIFYLAARSSRLVQQNRQMKARFIELDQMKKNFISHVSHELKAPLASMQETTHLMLERIPGPLTEKQQRLLDLNLQSGKRLAQMIGNILDLSRLEAGIVEYDMQPADIADLMHNVVLELSSQARERSLRILTDIQREPLLVECDPNRMVQLFTNLLENAVHFSHKGGFIGVHVRTIPQLPRMPHNARTRIANRASNGFALIGVSDSGPGIEDHHKESVFHTFHQAKQGKKSPGESLGLGLAISRAVVEAHKGTIWVEDNPSGGAIFFVLLPRVAAESGTLAQAS